MQHIIRVLLCGDPSLAGRLQRESLSRMPSVLTVGQTHSNTAAFELSRKLQPALVILVLPIGRLDVDEVARLLLKQAPGAKLLVVSSLWNSRGVHEVLSAGASGCLLTEGEPDEMVRAIQTVMFGGQYLSPAILHPDSRPGRPGAEFSSNHGRLAVPFRTNPKSAESYPPRL